MAKIIETARAAGSCDTLVKAVEAAGLVGTLSGPGPYTVFAPTDDAFRKLPPGTMDNLLKDQDKLKAILNYHVVQGKLTSADVMKQKSIRTVQGQNITVDTTRGVKVNDATVIKPDISADNGVIHMIDSVIQPR